MKKRIFALVCGLAVAITCVLLVGCGGSDSGGNKDLSGSKYVGTWSGQKASFQDTEVTVEEVLHGPFIVVLNGDGTADVTMGEEANMTATWSETDKGVKVKGDSINLEFEDKDGILDTSVIGMHFYLEKQ